jgi:hypothetical protein
MNKFLHVFCEFLYQSNVFTQSNQLKQVKRRLDIAHFSLKLSILIVFLTCLLPVFSQGKVFDFEKNIRIAFDMDDSMVFFRNGYKLGNRGLSYRLSEIKKVDINYLDSLCFPNKAEQEMLQELYNAPPIPNSSGNYSSSNKTIVWNTLTPDYKLVIGNIEFTLKVDFTTCKIYDVYSYLGSPIDGQIVGFEYEPDSDIPVSYRAYHHQRIRTGWETVGSENLSEKRYYFRLNDPLRRVDLNGTEEEKKELLALGKKIHKVVMQLLLTYKYNCKESMVQLMPDTVAIKHVIDSVFNLISQRNAIDSGNSPAVFDSTSAQIINVEVRIYETGIDAKFTYVIYEKGKRIFLPPDLDYLILNSFRKSIAYSEARYMCMPCPGSRNLKIKLLGGKVILFYK